MKGCRLCRGFSMEEYPRWGFSQTSLFFSIMTLYSKNRIGYGVVSVRLHKTICKIEIILDQREVAFLSPSKICEHLNFQRCTVEKFNFLQILLGDKNATSLCSKNISTLPVCNRLGCAVITSKSDCNWYSMFCIWLRLN